MYTLSLPHVFHLLHFLIQLAYCGSGVDHSEKKRVSRNPSSSSLSEHIHYFLQIWQNFSVDFRRQLLNVFRPDLPRLIWIPHRYQTRMVACWRSEPDTQRLLMDLGNRITPSPGLTMP
ncbi:hypothetical protein DPEC_G00146520 [Dallia pectoralis]|uniref:Uncharacterized protein n=1 Tax=Dallia pectoralis TaxID=75939 RepID=A0ACC2GPP7_DALPE|nr:hypothetical protein DPEC_G00146520 [Dallia pectoralis]